MLVELERPEDGIAVLRLNNSPLNLVTLELTRFTPSIVTPE